MEVDTKWTWGHIQHIQNTHTHKHVNIFIEYQMEHLLMLFHCASKKAQKLGDRIVTIWMTCTNTQKKGRRRSKKGQRKHQKTNVYTYRYIAAALPRRLYILYDGRCGRCDTVLVEFPGYCIGLSRNFISRFVESFWHQRGGRTTAASALTTWGIFLNSQKGNPSLLSSRLRRRWASSLAKEETKSKKNKNKKWEQHTVSKTLNGERRFREISSLLLSGKPHFSSSSPFWPIVSPAQ